MTETKPNNKIQATLQVIARLAADGFFEVILDVTGAYAFRDKLKANGFQFVRNRSAALPTDTPLDKAGERSKKSVWRRILIAVPPDVDDQRASTGLKQAMQSLEDLLQGVLEGSRIRGAKTVALKIQEQWPDTAEVKPIIDKLQVMDTPWVESAEDNYVPRPKFAA